MNTSHPRHICVLVTLLFFSWNLAAQQIQVTGVVTSIEDNLPIPGVTVSVPNGESGTITNLDGEYQINIPPNADSLQFRFVGMQPLKVAILERSEINVVMQPELYTVDEVVVTALGISRESKSLGYAVTAVDNEELTEGNSRSVLNALQGKVAGVNISSASGAPGSSTRILMRGVTSLSGGNQPLFIIDGVPVSNSQSGSSSINGGVDFGNKVNDLNPDDIESVSILKGASGTALYGSRAANGVIIITTKTGTQNAKSKITVNSSVLFESPLKLVTYQNNFGQGIYGDAVLYENTSWGPAFDNRFRPWGYAVDSSLRVKAYRALPENVEEFFETGISFNNSISFDGGNDNTSYYFSYSNIDWDGIFPTDADSYSKHTLSLRSSNKMSDRLRVTNSISYIKKINSFVPTGQGQQSVYNQIMQTPRDISLRELSDISVDFNTVDNYYSLYTLNPYFILKNNGNENNEDRVFGRIELDYNILKGLNLKGRLGGDISNEQRKVWRMRVEPEGNNEFSAVFEPGAVVESSVYQMELNSDIILTYNKSLGDFDINLLAGQSMNQRKVRGLSAGVNYLSVNSYFNLANTDQNPNASESTVLQRMVGVYGSADFAYRSMLFLAFSLRNEWSSTLPPQNNSYFFPSVNTGFIFTELTPNIQTVLSYGKIRASWARVGNDAAPYLVNSVFSRGAHSDGYGFFAYPIEVNNQGVNAYDVGNLLSNNQLKPEITDEFEVGTDLRFFKNRFSIDAAYFQKSTTDLIWAAPVAYSSGYTRQMQNLGKISNYAFEGLLRVVPVKRKNFEWEMSVNFTRNRNKLDYLSSQLESAELNALRVAGGQQISWQAIPGMPVGVFKARGPKYTTDGKIVVDNQGLPIADEDLVIYGNSQYNFTSGAFTRLRYKGLSLSAQLDIRQGGIMYSRTKNITLWAGTVPETLYNNRKPFIIPNSVVELEEDENGDPVYAENTTPIDAVNIVNYWGNGGSEIDGSSFIDKSFVKLRQVILSYSLPQNLMNSIPLEQIDISIVGKNLLLFTPEGQTYIDPELTTFGNDLLADFGEYGAQPSTRSVSLNLRIVF